MCLLQSVVCCVEPLVGIDKVRFGMTVEEMKQILGELTRTRDIVYRYIDAGFRIWATKDNIVAVINCRDMRRGDSSHIGSCRCRTSKGIAVGSSRKDLIEACGEPSSAASDSVGYHFVLRYESLKSEFGLMQDKIIGMWFGTGEFETGVGSTPR
jgi:hypothetical protein